MAARESDFSDIDDEWEEDLPLAAIRALGGRVDCTSDESEVEYELKSDDSSEGSSDPSDMDEDLPLDELKDEVTPLGRKWVKTPSGEPKKIPAFEEDVGVSDVVDREKTRRPYDFINLFLTLPFMTTIMNTTNDFAKEVREKAPELHKMRWKPMSIQELRNFIGLGFVMGLLPKPTIKLYWSTIRCILTPSFGTTMKRDRFTQILRYLHFNVAVPDDAGDAPRQPEHPSQRVAWLFNHFNTMTRKVYNPHKEVVIDESMVPFKGRLGFKQYLPNKPTKWGIKCWLLAESCSGYILHAIPYFGREDRGEKALHEHVAMKLMTAAGCLGKHFWLFLDNYYTSVNLMTTMLKHKTFCCGTVRKNRKELPSIIRKKKIKSLKSQGDMIFYKSSDMVFSMWQDKKPVNVLSTAHGTDTSSVNRIIKNTSSGKFEKRPLVCPSAVRTYSEFMGGVDLADQFMQYYRYQRKTNRWTIKLFWYVMEAIKVNCHLLRNMLFDKKMPLLNFTLHVVEYLLLSSDPNELPRLINFGPAMRLNNRCMPSQLQRKSYCHVCYKRWKAGVQERKSQTKFGCSVCQKHLCLPRCFTLYHTVEHFDRAVVDQ